MAAFTLGSGEAGSGWRELKQGISERWPENAASHARFYALGVDAYRITPYLGRFEGSLFGSYHGVTGNLTLDARQEVHRTLMWAQFRNGLPYVLESETETVTDTGTPAPRE